MGGPGSGKFIAGNEVAQNTGPNSVPQRGAGPTGLFTSGPPPPLVSFILLSSLFSLSTTSTYI
jgi:hypothetical protein